MKTTSILPLLLALCLPLYAGAEEKMMKPYKGSAAFEKIKSLAGNWEGTMEMPGKGEMPMKVQYRVVAGGSAVEERCFADTPMEMVTMYTEQNGKVVLTHYCMLHNQPVMQLKKETDKALRFGFVARKSALDPEKDPHMHGLTLTFKSDDEIVQNWVYYENGEAKKDHGKPIALKRVETKTK